MKQIKLENFRKNLANNLKELPFEITKRGKVIAVITPPNLKVQNNKPIKNDMNLKVEPEINPNLKVESKRQTTNHTVQTNINNPDDVKDWVGKLNTKGKFQTFFKK